MGKMNPALQPSARQPEGQSTPGLPIAALPPWALSREYGQQPRAQRAAGCVRTVSVDRGPWALHAAGCVREVSVDPGPWALHASGCVREVSGRAAPPDRATCPGAAPCLAHRRAHPRSDPTNDGRSAHPVDRPAGRQRRRERREVGRESSAWHVVGRGRA